LVAGAAAEVADIVIIGCKRRSIIERCVMILRIDFKFSIYIFNQNKCKCLKKLKKENEERNEKLYLNILVSFKNI
jgi:hypothetical protein